MNNDKAEREFLSGWIDRTIAISAKVRTASKADSVTAATNVLLKRLMASSCSMMTLYSDATHDWSADGATILRTSHDALLQLLFILSDKTQKLAERYLDFDTIAWRNFVDVIDKKLTDTTRSVAESPLRTRNELQLKQNLKNKASKHGFDTNKLPKNWYSGLPRIGSLAQVAEKVGYFGEYQLLHKILSDVVHSCIFGLHDMDHFKDATLVTYQFTFVDRALGGISEYNGITLTGEEIEIVKIARRSIFDEPYEPPGSAAGGFLP